MSPNEAISTLSLGKELEGLRFYVGGGFPPASGPNWSHDMTIIPNGNGANVTAKTSDPLCGKSGTISSTQLKNIFTLMAALRFTNSDTYSVDAGRTELTLDLINSPDKSLLLEFGDRAQDEPYAVNGENLIDQLEAIEDSLPTLCQ